MLLKDFLPGISLMEFVQCYRIVHFDFSATGQVPFKAYPPKPENCLHFFLRDRFAIGNKEDDKEYQPLMLFTGQQTSLVKQYTGKDFLDVQVVFQPTGIFRLRGIPSFELTNRFIDASCIFSKDIRDTFQQLQSAEGYHEILVIVESFVKKLVSRAKRDFNPIDLVSRHMFRGDMNVSLDWLAKEACLCTKQFKRKFFERAGVNPKTYTRIIRFNKVFNMKNRYPGRNWHSIASGCAYSDYQHLAKDYKDFTGLSPHQFHLLENNAPENALGLTKMVYRTRAGLFV